ncbi:MAG TPA: TadE/TadG family type IV pilus assembly protein [Vicinamibacterales bacterium]|nr:TadE/TadG family type IV pilus assembly protein [Vicinamibacterales bacterium]
MNALCRRLAALREKWMSDSGAEFVEAALAFPLLFFLVMGITEFGIMFQQYEVITNAAREGARIAVLPDYQSDLTDNVTTRVNDYVTAAMISMGGDLANDLSTTVSAPTTKQVGDDPPVCISTVTVTVSFKHTFLFLGGIANYFGATFGTKNLNAASTMRLESLASGC